MIDCLAFAAGLSSFPNGLGQPSAHALCVPQGCDFALLPFPLFFQVQPPRDSSES